MKLVFSFVIAILAFPSLHFAQNELTSLSPNPFVYFDEDRANYVVIEDEQTLQEFIKVSWVKKSYTYFSENFSFQEFNREFNPISVKGKGIFFVHKGGGIVYELRNDTLKRVDDSFLHKNQYGSNLYSYNNTIYNFGGYGLFTVKNFTVYYDFTMRQWYETFYDSPQKPKSREGAKHFLLTDTLYLFGGFSKKQRVTFQKFESDFWSLDLKRGVWRPLGQINNKIKSDFTNSFNSQRITPPFFIDGNTLLKIDVANNHYSVYRDENYSAIDKIIANTQNQNLLIFQYNTTKSGVTCSIITEKQLIGKVIETGQLYHPVSITSPKSQRPLWFWFFSPFLAAGLFFIYQKKKTKNTAISIFSLSDALLKEDFTDLEKKIVQLFLTHDNGLEIADLVPFFDEKNLSHDTLKKRRESFLRNLRSKLSEQSGIPFNEIFTEYRSDKDRRIKILKINTHLKIPV
jgi:hypothetical protein